jgi:hypothetical protein
MFIIIDISIAIMILPHILLWICSLLSSSFQSIAIRLKVKDAENGIDVITRDLELVNLELDLLSENHIVKDTGTDLYLHKFHPTILRLSLIRF